MRYLAIGLVLVAQSAFADGADHSVYKCVAADGAISYTNTACPIGAASDVMLKYNADSYAKPAPEPVTPTSAPVSYDDYLKRNAPPRTPATKPAVPLHATAQCNDGTYGYGANRRGTCIRHGGVAKWL
jgi:hypothetical protein